MARYKIFCFAETFPPRLGGSETVLYGLLSALAKLGLSIQVVTPYVKGSKEFDQKQRFQIQRSYLWHWLRSSRLWHWGFSNRLFRLIIIINLFLRALLTKKDIVFIGHVLPSGVTGLLLKRLLGVPYIVYTYGEDISMYSRTGRSRSVLKAVLAAAGAVITISSTTKEEISKLGVAETNVYVQYPSYDRELFDQAVVNTKELRAKLELTGNKVMLTVARVVERKGIDTVIKALPRLIEKFPDIKYLVVGDGDYRDRYQQLARELEVRQYVDFVREVNIEALPGYYSVCDVFVMPNRELASGEKEGFGLVFIEANACGKPVIGGRSGGTVEAIRDGETGFLVDPLDIDGLVEKISLLLEDEELARSMGQRGRQWVRESFDWDKKAAELMDIINKI